METFSADGRNLSCRQKAWGISNFLVYLTPFKTDAPDKRGYFSYKFEKVDFAEYKNLYNLHYKT